MVVHLKTRSEIFLLDEMKLMELPILLVTDGVLMPGSKMKIPVRTPANIVMVENCLLNKNEYKNKIVVAYRQDSASKKAFPIGTFASIDQIVCWSSNNSRVQYSLHVTGLARVEISNIDGPLCGCSELHNVCSDNLTAADETEFIESIKKLVVLITHENKHSLSLKQLKDLLTNVSGSQFDELTDLCMALVPGVPYVEQLTFLAELNVAKKMRTINELVLKMSTTRNLNMIEVSEHDGRDREDAIILLPRGGRRPRGLLPDFKELRPSRQRQGEDEMWKKIEHARIPPGPVMDVILHEYEKYVSLPPSSPEHAVLHSYLEYVAQLPWDISTKDKEDLVESKAILEADHEGMESVKQRILEFLAVKKLKQDMKGPILCLVGPPGVGKTSVAKSIASTLGRNFQRIALGGIRDQSDIRGHRRTYVGAMPGRIIHAMKLAKCNNPVILLDEVDKLGTGPQGDPGSALLEVLDPEQNGTFTDLYLNVPFDLSKVLFIATANDSKSIANPLLDRMEMIEMSSYSSSEKRKIARNHIIPRQVTRHALLSEYISFSEDSIDTMIEYTREAGVRQLERVVGAVCRNVALRVAESLNGGDVNADVISQKLKIPVVVDSHEVDFILKHKNKKRSESNIVEIIKADEPGVVFGLAWTPVGGEVLVIEAVLSAGTGKTVFTGNLGNVIKESIQVAQSLVRANAAVYELNLTSFEKADLHVHLPAGAIGKDGPSAGCAFTLAIFSAVSGRRVRKDSAVTGEVTLTGQILPVGGIKEKILAAHRNRIYRVLLPKANETDVRELETDIRDLMKFVFVDNVHKLFSKMIDGPMPVIHKKQPPELYSKI